MRVYDFDKTIYNGDSAIDFYLYSIKKNPLLIRYLPKQALGCILYIIKIFNKEKFKTYFYSYFKGIKNIDSETNKFWDKNQNKIYEWYLNDLKDNDVIITASPEFFIKEIMSRLGKQTVIGSIVDKYTGEYSGKNCYGIEKVKRYNEIYSNKEIDEFYSDSLSDTPLAKISKKSFLVEKGKVKTWR